MEMPGEIFDMGDGSFLTDEDIAEGQRLLDADMSLTCLLYTSPSPRDQRGSRMPSSA